MTNAGDSIDDDLTDEQMAERLDALDDEIDEKAERLERLRKQRVLLRAKLASNPIPLVVTLVDEHEPVDESELIDIATSESKFTSDDVQEGIADAMRRGRVYRAGDSLRTP